MMKNKMKLLVAFGLVVSMLAGCGSVNSSSSEEKSSEQNVSTQQSESKTESQVEESTYPDYLNLESARPIVKEGEEITLKIAVVRKSQAETDVEDTWFYKFIEEKLNINLEVEWLTDANKGERKSLMLSANDMPDIMIGIGINQQDVVKYGVENEQFLAMSDWASEELTPNMLAMWEEYEQYMDDFIMNDGKIYTVPVIKTLGQIGSGDTVGSARVFFDTKYMDAAGITELPTTLDDFVEALRAFKALDPKEMGVEEIYPLITMWFQERMLFMNALGWLAVDPGDYTAPCWDMETKQVLVPCLDDKFADYVTLYNTLYTEGLIHPDYFTMDKTTARALYTSGAVAVNCDSAPYVTMPDRYEEFEMSLPLTSEHCPEPITTAKSVTSTGQIYVSASTEYPELCMRFIDYLCSTEGIVYSYTGPLAGSEDALGMKVGFEMNEDGTAKYPYADLYPDGSYQVNMNFFQYQALNYGNAGLLMQKFAGIENPVQQQLNPNTGDGYAKIDVATKQKGTLYSPLPTLFVGSEIYEDYSDLKTLLKNEVNTEVAKFIVGQRDLSELPQFIEDLRAMGGDEYEKIIQDAYANYEGPRKK